MYLKLNLKMATMRRYMRSRRYKTASSQSPVAAAHEADSHLIYFPKRHPVLIDRVLVDGGRRLQSRICAGSSRPLPPRNPNGSPIRWRPGATAHTHSKTRTTIEVAVVQSRSRVRDWLCPDTTYLPGKATGQPRPYDDRLQTPTTIHT